MNVLGLYLLIAGGLIFTVGDVLMRFWVGNNKWWYYVGGLAFYLLGVNFLAQSYRFRNIAVASSVIVVINIVTLTLFSWFYFKAKLTPMELFGLGLAIVSVLILEFGNQWS